VVGVPQNNLSANIVSQLVLVYAFYRSLRANRHKNRGLDGAVIRFDGSRSRFGIRVLMFNGKSHDCKDNFNNFPPLIPVGIVIGLFSLLTGSVILALGFTYVYPLRVRPKPPPAVTSQDLPAITVLICARNAAVHLRRNLPKWSAQLGVKLQILVVDDHSTDPTQEVLQQLAFPVQAAGHELQVVELDSPITAKLGKKHALLQGLKRVKYPLLALTDADCAPASSEHLSRMALHFSDSSVDAVLGHAPLIPSAKGSLLGRLQQWDTALTAAQMSGCALRNAPYMALGRNVMYRTAVYDPRALETTLHQLAGDDDLAFQQLKLGEVRVEEDPRARVESPAPPSLWAWFRQKRRHYGVSGAYRGRSTSVLAALRVGQILVMMGGIAALWNASQAAIGWLFFLGAMIYWAIRIAGSLRRMHQSDLISHLLLEPLRYTFVTTVMISVLIKPKRSW